VAYDGPLFAEGPGAFVVSGPRAALGRFGAAATEIGEVGGAALVIERELELPVDEIARAHSEGLVRLLGWKQSS
jgi:phosphoribosylformylglycinamidine synthase subunit PurL